MKGEAAAGRCAFSIDIKASKFLAGAAPEDADKGASVYQRLQTPPCAALSYCANGAVPIGSMGKLRRSHSAPQDLWRLGAAKHNAAADDGVGQSRGRQSNTRMKPPITSSEGGSNKRRLNSRAVISKPASSSSFRSSLKEADGVQQA